MVNVTVVGARGYLGREALRLLQNHPSVDALHAVSLSGAGGRLQESVPSFRAKDLPLEGPDERMIEGADVIFLATAAGQAAELAQRMAQEHDTLLVDLSRDHRLQALESPHEQVQVASTTQGGNVGSQVISGDPAPSAGKPDQAETWAWVYGLPETPLAPRAGDRRIASPGCYPTAALLSILPAVSSGLANPGTLIVDGKSGVSGAGATPRADLHYAETNENTRAYKVIGHDHGDEIQAAVARAATQKNGGSPGERPVRFTPHLVPMNRGLLTTSYIGVAPGTSEQEVRQVYEDAYANALTVDMVDEPATAPLRGTARAEIAVDLDSRTNLLVVRAAIDNLTKGGSGQGVHNMNIALGEEPTLGLPLLGGGP